MHRSSVRQRALSILVPGACASIALLAACWAPSSNGETPSSDDSTAEAAPSGPTSTPGDESPRTDLADEHPLALTSVDEVSETMLRLHVVAGDPACSGLRAEVAEKPTEVVVTVYEGTLPEAPEVCTAVGRVASLTVELSDPLGDRPVSQAP